MKFLKRISAIVVSTMMLFSIAEMNVFAASTTQDGLEVSLTTDKENYSKDEKITVTLSVKNTNITDVTDVTMETTAPDGYKVDNGLSNVKILETLASNETAELKIAYVFDAYRQESQSHEMNNNPKSEFSQNSAVNSININNEEMSTTSSMNENTFNTGDDFTFLAIILLIVISSMLIMIVCIRKNPRKFLSLILAISLVGGTLAISHIQTNVNAESNKIISLANTVKIDGDDFSIDAYIKYNSVNTPNEDDILPDSIEENIKNYFDGDYIYIPQKENLVFDDESCVSYYNNMVNVFTYNDLSKEEMDELADSINAKVVGDISGAINYLQLLIPKTDIHTIQSYADKIMGFDSVIYATYDFPLIMEETNDNNPWSNNTTTISDKGNEDNPSGNDWWAEAVHAYTAWNYSDYAKSINIGVIDSGFKLDHPDYGDNIELLDGYADNSEDNHGTSVLGLIAAENNDIGIRGMADKAKVFCVDYTPTTDNKNSSEYRQLTTGEIIHVIETMIREKDVSVINNSFGFSLCSEEQFNISNDLLTRYGTYERYYQAISISVEETATMCMSCIVDLLYNKYDKFIIVQAAGNSCMNVEISGWYNAITRERFNNYKINCGLLFDIDFDDINQHIIRVGATSRKENGHYNMFHTSNYGSNIDICAPGEEVLTTVIANDFNYGYMGETSMAAPIVSGSVALVWSLNPYYTAGEVKDLLIKSSTDRVNGIGIDSMTYPMLNVGKAAERAYEEYRLNHYLKVNGTVKDKEGKTLQDVTVKLNNGQENFYTKTNALGQYIFDIEKFDHTEYELEFSKERYTTISTEFMNLTSREFKKDVILNLQQNDGDYYGVIVGKVLTEDNIPIKDAKIEIYTSSEDKAIRFGEDECYTNDKGEFSISMPEGKYLLVVTHDGYDPVNIKSVTVKANKINVLSNIILKQLFNQEKCYESYLDVVDNLVKQYGEGEIVADPSFENYLCLNGLGVVRLIDFDGDGHEELLCSGGDFKNDTLRYGFIKIYNFVNGKANVIYDSKTLHYGPEPSNHVCYCVENNKILLLTKRHAQTFSTDEWSEFNGNTFVVVKRYSNMPNADEMNSGKQWVYRLNDKIVDKEIFMEEFNKMRNQAVDLNLNRANNEQIIPILDETNNVLQRLGYQFQNNSSHMTGNIVRVDNVYYYLGYDDESNLNLYKGGTDMKEKVKLDSIVSFTDPNAYSQISNLNTYSFPQLYSYKERIYYNKSNDFYCYDTKNQQVIKITSGNLLDSYENYLLYSVDSNKEFYKYDFRTSKSQLIKKFNLQSAQYKGIINDKIYISYGSTIFYFDIYNNEKSINIQDVVDQFNIDSQKFESFKIGNIVFHNNKIYFIIVKTSNGGSTSVITDSYLVYMNTDESEIKYIHIDKVTDRQNDINHSQSISYIDGYDVYIGNGKINMNNGKISYVGAIANNSVVFSNEKNVIYNKDGLWYLANTDFSNEKKIADETTYKSLNSTADSVYGVSYGIVDNYLLMNIALRTFRTGGWRGQVVKYVETLIELDKL